MVVRVRHVIFIQMAAWIPWILWAFDRWLEQRRRTHLLALAVFGALSILAGALSLEVLAALPVIAYVIARLASAWRAEPPQKRLRRVAVDIGALLGVTALGLSLAAAQVVPSLAHLPESPRSLGTSYEFASSYAWPNLRYALTLLLPDLYGNNMRGRYVGAFNYWEMAGYFVGIVPWLLAPFAALWRGQGFFLRRELAAMAAVGLVAIGAALGDAGPVHKVLYHGLPLYATLRCPTRALFIVVLVVPVLAAHGAHALFRERSGEGGERSGEGGSPNERRWFLLLAALAMGLVLLGVAIYARLAPGEQAARYGAVRLALVSGAVALLGGLTFLRVVAASGALLAVTLLVPLELLWQNAGYLRAEPPSYPAGTERFQALEWVREHGMGSRFVNDGRGPFRLHNVGMVYGLENASGYDSVPVWRYVNFLQILNYGRPYPHAKLKHDLAAASVVNFDSRLLDLLNVKYVITFRSLSAPRYRLVFRPQSPTTLAWAEQFWDQRLMVYENTTVLPRAFLLYEMQVVDGPDAAAMALARQDFDPGRTVILEKQPAIPPTPADPGEPALRPANVLRHERHRILIEAVTPKPGILVLSEVFYPGWQARVDGKPAEILRADYALRAVALPAGRHTVELVYRNRAALAGIGVSLAGLVVLIALICRPRVVRNPQSATS